MGIYIIGVEVGGKLLIGCDGGRWGVRCVVVGRVSGWDERLLN